MATDAEQQEVNTTNLPSTATTETSDTTATNTTQEDSRDSIPTATISIKTITLESSDNPTSVLNTATTRLPEMTITTLEDISNAPSNTNILPTIIQELLPPNNEAVGRNPSRPTQAIIGAVVGTFATVTTSIVVLVLLVIAVRKLSNRKSVLPTTCNGVQESNEVTNALDYNYAYASIDQTAMPGVFPPHHQPSYGGQMLQLGIEISTTPTFTHPSAHSQQDMEMTPNYAYIHDIVGSLSLQENVSYSSSAMDTDPTYAIPAQI